MLFHGRSLLLLTTLVLVVVVVQTIHASQIHFSEENGVKYGVYLSPKLVLGAGSVSNTNHSNIDFPKGHIAIKEFRGELVDEMGSPIPLHETYIHHSYVVRYYAETDVNGQELNIVPVKNGVCEGYPQYLGLGSETRRTDSYVPDPYGIQVGNPADIPDGYDEERWSLNVHAIDTRGTVDRLGCTECRCGLYNITRDEFGRPLASDYVGGFLCCYDQTQCKLRQGFESTQRSLYLKYTVKWVDWVDTILPLQIFVLDVTDCKVEYNVEYCGMAGNGCVDNKKTNVVMPKGGYVIYVSAHQHSGGIGTALYREDGSKICSSMPIYGQGKEAGNEAGYVVGMTTCYPHPGSIKISDGEKLVLESNYSSSQMHTGVMGVFYLLIAHQLPNDKLLLNIQANDNMEFAKYSWVLVFVGVALVAMAGISYMRRIKREEGYQPLVV